MGDAVLKGLLIPDGGAPLPFLYNPVEIPESYGAEYDSPRGAGRSHPHNHYTGGTNQEINFSMGLRNPWRWLGKSTPVPLEPYITLLFDLCLPIHIGGQMVDGPPTVTFLFGAIVKRVKIRRIEVVRKRWTEMLALKEATVDVDMFEVLETTKNRVNSYKTWKQEFAV